MPDWKKRFAASYRYMRVDRKTGLDVERLRNIRNGGSIERNQDTSYETGKVEYLGKLDLGSDLLRIYLDAEFPDGTTASEPLGTFVVSTPKRSTGYNSSEADLSGRLSEVAEDEFDAPRSLAAGSNAVDEAARLLREAGLEVVAEPSDFKLTTTWVVGAIGNGGSSYATRLKAVNALLDAAGFSAASCDPMGRVLLRRYVEPDKRAPAMVMEEGKEARFEDGRHRGARQVERGERRARRLLDDRREREGDGDRRRPGQPVLDGDARLAQIRQVHQERAAAGLDAGRAAGQRERRGRHAAAHAAVGDPQAEGDAYLRTGHRGRRHRGPLAQRRDIRELRDTKADSHPRGRMPDGIGDEAL